MFYTAVVDDSEDNFEEETAVFAVTFTEESSYSYTLFHSTEVIGPLLLFRIVADAIDFIEQSDKSSLLEDLEELSTGSTSSLTMKDIADQKRIYDSDVYEFKTVLELIEAGRKENSTIQFYGLS